MGKNEITKTSSIKNSIKGTAIKSIVNGSGRSKSAKRA